MTPIKKRLAGALLLAACLMLALGAPLRAEDQYTDAKLKSFVVAAVEVNRLIVFWSPKIEGAETEDERAELAQTANAQLVQAVEGTEGITLDEYNAIAQAARADQDLSSRIRTIAQAIEE